MVGSKWRFVALQLGICCAAKGLAIPSRAERKTADPEREKEGGSKGVASQSLRERSA
jgi:hypothetical protein